MFVGGVLGEGRGWGKTVVDSKLAESWRAGATFWGSRGLSGVSRARFAMARFNARTIREAADSIASGILW